MQMQTLPRLLACLIFFLPPKMAMAIKKIVVRMCVSLQETKQSNSNGKFATR
jgi:hypothetical protein